MKIALLGSPRCGNNWVRRVMSDVLGYPHFAAHSVNDFPEDLPPDCILNIHALNEPLENAFFEGRSCQFIVLARHPLDVFVSVLQFARNEPAVHKWLNGSCDLPHDAASLCPDDARFVDWMTGKGARNLLSVPSLGGEILDPQSAFVMKTSSRGHTRLSTAFSAVWAPRASMIWTRRWTNTPFHISPNSRTMDGSAAREPIDDLSRLQTVNGSTPHRRTILRPWAIARGVTIVFLMRRRETSISLLYPWR